MSRTYWFVLNVLAVWRITHLLQAEDGPVDLFVRLRRWVGQGFFGRLLDCFKCLSLWIAIPFALCMGQEWGERLLLWPALSAGAIILQSLVEHLERPTVAPYLEDEEDKDAVLRE